MRQGPLILLVLLVSSCDSGTFDPFENDQQYFTIYGFLDERSTNHFVRVIPVTRNAAHIPTTTTGQASIDAMVTSTDLRDGTVTRWEHSLEQLDDGNYGHVFWGRFQVRAGRTYRLDVVRNDGKSAWAETTIPRLPVAIPQPDTLFFPYESSPDDNLAADVYLSQIPSPWDIKLVYDLQGTQVTVPIGRPGQRTEDGGWRFSVDMGRDKHMMREVLNWGEAAALPLLHAITVQVRLLAEEWDPPRGVFDPEVLAQPGVMTNVNNGHGIWSGIGLYQYTWIAPTQ